MMPKMVNICDVCSEIFAGGDAPKNNMSIEKTDKYNIPIYSNGEANDGLYGFTNFARVSEPSITISARGTIGYTSVRNTPFVPIVRLITLVPKKDIIDIRYLFYAAQNYKFDGSGTSIPQLTVPALKKYNFPLPEIEEQKQIVGMLDKICDLIDLRKQQLSKLDELVKARFVELFGDVLTNEKSWETAIWNDVLTIKNGKNQKQVENPTGQYPICGSGGIMGYADNYISEANSVIIGRKGNINKPILMREKYWNVDTAFGLEPNNKFLLVDFLFLFCVLFDFEKLNKAVTIPSLTKADLLKIEIPIPPIELQNEFADFVKQIDKSKFEVQQSLEKLETLKKSLMQQYFG